jgi:acetate kinase
VYAIRHYVGAFMLELGSVDVITFSGGIGENSSAIRASVLKDLSGFGIELDAVMNDSIEDEGAISSDNSKVKVLVVPANEEIVIARETVAVVNGAKATAQAMAAGAM